jgi:UDP-N-acetyl-D-mannosaminuronic acid dehydrogenase
MKNDFSDQTVCILGLGYVGLTLSTVLADVGYQVVGVDKDVGLVENLKGGKAPFHEKGLPEMLAKVSNSSNPPAYLSDIAGISANTYIVTVGTPIIRPSLQPNLDYIRAATREIARVLKKGNLVILRSTVPTGTTREVVLPILEAESGLSAGQDFCLAFCPERTVEGRALKELRELPQVIGGFDTQSAEVVTKLFQKSTPTIMDVGSLEAAEMLKIMDNTYRDVMFAYSNQMAMVCEAAGVDMVEIVRAANQGYNRNSISVPSPGVGGACLSKDPYILASVCERHGIDPVLFREGRRINEKMPIRVVECVEAELGALSKTLETARVLVLGFAFKGRPETSDMRGSPTIDLVNALKAKGAHVLGHDPLVQHKDISALGVEVTSIEDGASNADAIVIMTNHPDYEELDVSKIARDRCEPIIVYDGWHLFSVENFAGDMNVIYRCVGL